MLPHTFAWPPPICCSCGAAISEAFSTATPHFDSTTQPPEAESGLIAEHSAADTAVSTCRSTSVPEAPTKSHYTKISVSGIGGEDLAIFFP